MPAPTSYSVVVAGSPPSTIAALAVVPPMSKEITLSSPAARATAAQAITPAAGPDSTMHAGREAVADADIVPPLDCMICSGARTPLSRSRAASDST